MQSLQFHLQHCVTFFRLTCFFLSQHHMSSGVHHLLRLVFINLLRILGSPTLRNHCNVWSTCLRTLYHRSLIHCKRSNITETKYRRLDKDRSTRENERPTKHRSQKIANKSDCNHISMVLSHTTFIIHLNNLVFIPPISVLDSTLQLFLNNHCSPPLLTLTPYLTFH